MKLTRIEKLLLIVDFIKEALQKFWQKIYGGRFLKAFACLSILLISIAIFFAIKPKAQALPSCSALADNVTPNPGVNCLYFGLPLCSTIVAPNIPKHRVNCADIVDLPLCSDIVTGDGVSVKPGKNCVELCSNSAYNNPDPDNHPEWVRSVDFAIYNRDCIRFCDSVEEGVLPNPGVNCAERKCHQLVEGSNPVEGVNCNMLPCNLLTPDELNKAKFDDSTQKYCQGDNLKCYQFTQAQLKFMRLRKTNPTCIIHDCAPLVATCGPNDVLNIKNQGAQYQEVYERYINGGISVDSNAFCKQLDCKPVIKSQYRCTSQGLPDNRGIVNIYSVGITSSIKGDDTDIYRNPSCDSTGDGSLCGTVISGDSKDLDRLTNVTNYCYKTIDCNEQKNSQAPECLVATSSPDDDPKKNDPFTSWFYRPKPSDKAINRTTGILWPMRDNLCYSEGQMRDRGWGKKIDFFFFSSWFHSSWIDDVRSPGACNTNHDGNRGTGYAYLCGTGGQLYNRPSEDVAYFEGYAVTDFSGAFPKHKVRICVRYKNTLSLSTCGERTCGVNAWFDDFTSQACGGDVCRDLVIDEENETECMMSDNLSNSSTGDCGSALGSGASLDKYMRVRAVKYNDKICGFLDSKGQFAYNNMFFNGTEYITFNQDDEINPDTSCVNDPTGISPDCHGFSSNSSQGLADRWRTLMRVHYVDNNRPPSTSAELRGYIDKNGKLYREQACPKVTLRVPPPDLYNIGTVSNSERLFSPPVSIRNVTKIRGGSDAIIPAGQIYGKTDFHYPEMKILFGSVVQKMSLGFGYTGYEDQDHAESNPSSPASINLTSTFNGKDYEARLFVRKEANDSGIPQFCLYRKIKNQDGLEIAPLRIGCVERNAPDINNAKDRLIDPSLPLRKIIIYPKAGGIYNNSELTFRYLDGGANKIDNNCTGSDNVCSQPISLGNPDYKIPVCFQDQEQHKICVQREECTAIYIECIQNEIDLSNAKNLNQSTESFLSVRKQCNETLVPSCNAKKGVSIFGDIFNPVPSGSQIDPLAYGWYSELCIVTGFKSKLRKILAHTTQSGVKGKCIIDQTSPYLTDKDNTTNCDDGGRAPNCICWQAPANYDLQPNQELRLETPREAGLCIDIPLPNFCPLIDYNKVPNFDLNDPEYVNSSLGKTTYNNATGVHLSHQDRSNGNISGHAEFSKSLPGMNDVRGECKGFWTYDKNSAGVVLFPQQSCLMNNGVVDWDKNVRNPCVRYSCPDVLTAGPDASGTSYQAGYGYNEVGESKGLSNGFATWLKYTKTNDFLETASARACIPGFKPNGSTPIIQNGVIVGYNGGALPTRQCDQLGNWKNVTNSCVRIYCPEVNIPKPTSSSDIAGWSAWYNNGGARFPSVVASRSAVRTQPESIATGTCDNSVGFFQAGSPPTRECDYLGNWKPVKSSCATACTVIASDDEGSSLNNGFAKWSGVTKKQITIYQHCGYSGWVADFDIGNYPITSAEQNDASAIILPKDVKATLYTGENYTGNAQELTSNNGCFVDFGMNDLVRSMKFEYTANASLDGEFAGCVAGYVTNPYPPAFDPDGRPLPASIANDLSRSSQDPRRSCNLVQGTSFTTWGGVFNPCINKCPGATEDSRIGVGITTHPIKSSLLGKININWPATDLGQYAYVTNWNGIESLFNAVYFQGSNISPRTNGYYLMRRYCNNNGKWSDPEPMCSVNNGQIKNAKYFTNNPAGYKNSIIAGNPESTVAGTCINDTYWYSNGGTGAQPLRKCVFGDEDKNIDRVYLELANNTLDCEFKTCRSFTGWVGEVGKIPATDPVQNPSNVPDPRFVAGSGQLVGSCITNTETSSNKNSSNQVVYASLVNGGTNPYSNCKSDGTWSAPSDASCKKGCDIPAISNIRVNDRGDNDVGDDDGIGFNYPAFTMQHGQYIVVEITDKAGGGCTQKFVTVTCDDGVQTTNVKSWAKDNGRAGECAVSTYNSATKNVDLVEDFVRFRKDYQGAQDARGQGFAYIDKYGNSAILNYKTWGW